MNQSNYQSIIPSIIDNVYSQSWLKVAASSSLHALSQKAVGNSLCLHDHYTAEHTAEGTEQIDSVRDTSR